MAGEISVELYDLESGRTLGIHPLPAHTSERLIAAAHAAAIVAGELPNQGMPLDRARVSLCTGTQELEVELGVQGSSSTRRFAQRSVRDDVETLNARRALVQDGLLENGQVPAVRFSLIAAPAAPVRELCLTAQPFPRSLPRVPSLSLERAGLHTLPRCSHLAIFLSQLDAARLLVHARRTPQVEVGALLIGRPFLIEEDVPCRLGLNLLEAVPLAHGTRGSAHELRIPPAALAAVPVDAARGHARAGLAHSHPDARTPAFFLSTHDKAFATGFFWLPWQIQLVIDPGALDPANALAAFCWVDAALERVCLQVTDSDLFKGDRTWRS